MEGSRKDESRAGLLMPGFEARREDTRRSLARNCCSRSSCTSLHRCSEGAACRRRRRRREQASCIGAESLGTSCSCSFSSFPSNCSSCTRSAKSSEKEGKSMA